MEIQILSPTKAQPLPPVEWNYGELKAWIESGLERYKGVVYDDTQIATAKKDRATLNKLAQAIDEKRREMKRTYLQPYEEFEAQAKELVAMVKSQSDAIDAQVKAYEAFCKQEKRAKIEAEIYAPMIGNLAELVPYDRLHEAKWLNVTCSMGTVGEELARKIGRITDGLEAIDKMAYPPDLLEQAKLEFLRTFDLSGAISATDRVIQQREALARREAEMAARREAEEKARSEAAQKPAEPEFCPRPEFTHPAQESPAEDRPEADSTEEKIHVVSFRIRVKTSQLKALGDFMRANGIKPERI